MRRRRLLLFLLGCCGFAVLSLGCQLNPFLAPEPPTPVSAKNFNVAILLPGAKNDGSWSQAGYEGLKLVEKELGARVAYQENTGEFSETKKERLFESYAQKKYDFVIGHGGEYVAAIERAAQKYPRVKFAAITNCPGNNINQGCLGFRSGELGYLTGAIAAMKSQTGKIAFIGGVDYEHVKEPSILFERGAKAIDPNIEVSIRWLNSWTDKEKAEQFARAELAAGTDVILALAEPAEESIFALAETQEFLLIGWSSDRAPLAPERVITSAIQDAPTLLLQGAILVQTGRWQGKQYKFGIGEGIQKLAPFRGHLTAAEKARVQEKIEGILADRIDVFPD